MFLSAAVGSKAISVLRPVVKNGYGRTAAVKNLSVSCQSYGPRCYSTATSSDEGPEPSFFQMVEMFFDKSVTLLESKLVEESQMGRITLEEKKKTR